MVHKYTVNISLIAIGKIELIKGKAIDSHIRIIPEIEKNLHIKIAPSALDRIMDIILDNAIKYTIPQGNIYINLKSTYKDVILTVRNSGPGIPAEQLKHIVKQPEQNTFNKKSFRYRGAGLAWVKSVLADISGNISIECDVNKETIVTITFKRRITQKEKTYKFLEQLEYQKPVKRKNIRLKQTKYEETKSTILIMEKDMKVLCFMQEHMEEEFNFYYIRNFSTINQQLKKIPKPDIVVINMTSRNYSLSEYVQETWKNQDILFLFYTVKAKKRELLKGLRYAGAVDYIDRPCSIQVLISKIKSILRYRENCIIRKMENMKKNISTIIQHDIKDDGTFERRAALYNLTKREQEIMQCAILDMNNKEIAEKTGVNEDSVELFIKNIQERCHKHTRFQLITYFRGLG